MDMRNIGISSFCSWRTLSILLRYFMEFISIGPECPSNKGTAILKILSRFCLFVLIAPSLLFMRRSLTLVIYNLVLLSISSAYICDSSIEDTDDSEYYLGSSFIAFKLFELCYLCFIEENFFSPFFFFIKSSFCIFFLISL